MARHQLSPSEIVSSPRKHHKRTLNYPNHLSTRHHISDRRKLKKPKQAVSVAKIFKTSNSKRHGRERERHSAKGTTSIISDLKEKLNQVGLDIANDAVCTFEDALALHVRNLNFIKEDDRKALETTSIALSNLTAPLTAGPSSEIDKFYSKSNLSPAHDRTDYLAKYKEIIKIEQEKLEKYWEQWDAVRVEFAELGIEVFGQLSHGENLPAQKKGFAAETESSILEQTLKVVEFKEEIKKLSAQIIQRMRKSEKELDAISKKEKARLLASLVSNL